MTKSSMALSGNALRRTTLRIITLERMTLRIVTPRRMTLGRITPIRRRQTKRNLSEI
jgi:hypothetical protein